MPEYKKFNLDYLIHYLVFILFGPIPIDKLNFRG